MKFDTALMRLIQEPEKEIRRRGWTYQPSLVLKANLNEPAPSKDEIRWTSCLYWAPTMTAANLTVEDYIAADWTIQKGKS